MDLLERDAPLSAIGDALAEAATGAGRVVLVSGEAGVGKSALVAELARRLAGRARVLAGQCDHLTVPRALGPIHDIARGAGGALAAAVAADGSREPVLSALLDELAARPPERVMVIEDAHWADEGTLDLLAAVLGRRIGGLDDPGRGHAHATHTSPASSPAPCTPRAWRAPQARGGRCASCRPGAGCDCASGPVTAPVVTQTVPAARGGGC